MDEIRIIPKREIRRFIKECLIAVETDEDVAEAQALLMADTDEMGYMGHGIDKLETLIHYIITGICDAKAKPEIIKESDSCALINGNNALGAYTGIYCMEKAIEKAKSTGVGWVTCTNANESGMQCFYSFMALKQGMIGLTFANNAPATIPTRAKESALGTNPLTMCAPAKGDDYFLLDMSTSVVSLEKLQLYKKLKRPLPIGWAIDESKHYTTEADIALKKPLLLPLGGMEENAGYKGSGLSMLVEILCGISSGSSYGHHIKPIDNRYEPANLGQCYIAVDPKRFAPGFEDRLSDMLDHVRKMPPAKPDKPVMVPGDRERNNMVNVHKNGGTPYFEFQLSTCTKLASKYGIDPIRDIDGRMVGPGGAGGYLCKSTCMKHKDI